ncbi:type I polyketide synthase [Streptomyces sp. NPDC052396]|uniref:type I polyketide synthase n=1 Tax=Streptomyces sp. NPDC052396 TaxID=3365689 RepID=UPI0037D83EC6
MTTQEQTAEPDGRIAVIGLACRYPGARNAEGFWANLRSGVESISRFPGSGAPDSRTVNAAGVVADIDRFDAALFGCTARDAAVLDPQQRLFLECSWEALESAGYDTLRYPGSVGVFAGQASSAYLRRIQATPGLRDRIPHRRLELGNDKDFLATSVAYRMNLRGPAMSVQSACSTSLVAVHLAAQSLLNGECDLALAGGVSLRVPQETGYVPEQGISSLDGHCRAFDKDASGSVPSGGVGVVVLKPLAAALADGDTVRAVILGSAVNNDGAARVGYTAPGVEGQTAVIREAMEIADVDPESISYVEAHGTATPLGDMIEAAALTAAYHTHTDRRGWCRLGSVKTNIGHADAAAGVAGLIKTVLALENQLIPPSLNHQEPNPRIGFENTPFSVVTTATPWLRTAAPRRAGVSSFGMGGTNAHLVLEEAPATTPADGGGADELLLLSALTPAALDRLLDRTAAFLQDNPGVRLADAAHTLRVGRRVLPHRAMVVCGDATEAVRVLSAKEAYRGHARDEAPPVDFFFSDGPSDPAGPDPELAVQLSRLSPSFAADFAELATVVRTETGQDVQQDGRLLLFAVQTALARQFTAWGVRPRAVSGDGVGRHAAACHSGALRPAEAVHALLNNRNDRTGALAEAIEPGPLTVVIGGAGEPGGGGCAIPLHGRTAAQAWAGLQTALGRLWTEGAAGAPSTMPGDEHRRRIPLPTYPFERERHWLAAEPEISEASDPRTVLRDQLQLMRTQLAFLSSRQDHNREQLSL